MAHFLLKPLADPGVVDIHDKLPAAIDTFKPVNASITGAGTSTIWTPATNKSFVLYGWDLHLTITTVLAAAAGAVTYGLYDASVSDANLMGAIEVLRSDASKGQMYSTQLVRSFGQQSAAENQALIVGPHVTVNSGVVRIAGVVWGTEV